MTANPSVQNAIFGSQSVKRARTGPDGLLAKLDLNTDLVATEGQLQLDLENPYNHSEHDLPRAAIEIAINWEI